MCRQDNESVKVAPESVLSNRGNLDQVFAGVGLSPGVISGGGISPYTLLHDRFVYDDRPE